MLARSAYIRQFTRRDGVRLVIFGLLLAIVLGGVLAIDALPGPFASSNVVVDDVAVADVRAPSARTYDSEIATSLRRQEARDAVQPQYDYSQDRGQSTAAQQLAAFDATVQPVDAAYTAVLTEEARQAALRQAIPTLTSAAQATLAAMD